MHIFVSENQAKSWKSAQQKKRRKCDKSDGTIKILKKKRPIFCSSFKTTQAIKMKLGFILENSTLNSSTMSKKDRKNKKGKKRRRKYPITVQR